MDAWMLAECPAKSGSKSGNPRMHCTCDELYRDSHAGHVKRALTAEQRNAQHAAGGPYGAPNVPASPEAIAAVIEKRLSNTTAITLGKVERAARDDYAPLKAEDGDGITKFYQFLFQGDGTIKCRQLSGEGDWQVMTTHMRHATEANADTDYIPPTRRTPAKRAPSEKALLGIAGR